MQFIYNVIRKVFGFFCFMINWYFVIIGVKDFYWLGKERVVIVSGCFKVEEKGIYKGFGEI